MANTLLNDIVSLSRFYGADPKWVVVGGGNTSYKDENTLYVKASGYPLASITEEGFALMDRRRLAAIWTNSYPSGEDAASVAERERLVLKDMMAARRAGETRRPSVETLLHDILPWPLIVHLHPTLVNGLTCGKQGPEIAAEMFGNSQLWIPVTDPGYVLAAAIRREMEKRTALGLAPPDWIFLANHGIFAGGETAEEIKEKYSRLQTALESRLARRPGNMPQTAPFPGSKEKMDVAAAEVFGPAGQWIYLSGGEINRYLPGREEAAPLTGSLTPDHIVYAGPGAVYIDASGSDEQTLPSLWKKTAAEYSASWGKPPNLALVKTQTQGGIIVAAAGENSLSNARLLLENALEVCSYAESFGGVSLLDERFIRFIVNWEVENYRSKQAGA